MLFDTHCHLDFKDFEEDLNAVLASAQKNGVTFMLNAGCSLESSRRGIELSEKHENIFASIGIHPHYAKNMSSSLWEEFRMMARSDIVAVGECGLDYYRKLSAKNKQTEVFEKQIILSKELNLPLILHSREAEDDIIAILKNYDVKQAVAHCFSGSAKYMDFCMERGFFISFAGNVTYPRSSKLREAAKNVPLELLLLETDCPFLCPQPFRGKRCEPWHITFVRDEISRIKSMDAKTIEEITTKNACRCFGIKI